MVSRVLARDGGAVVKADLGTGGSGVIVVDTERARMSRPALESWLKDTMARRPALFQKGPFVVEALVGERVGSPGAGGATFVTVVIGADGDVQVLGIAREIRDDANRISAIEIGKDVEASAPRELFDEPVRNLARAAASLGYRGPAVFDFMVRPTAPPLVLEMNPRRGTTGFIYTVAQALFGADWMQRHCGVIRLPIPISASSRMDPERALEVIEATNRHLDGAGHIAPVSLTWLSLPRPGLAVAVFAADRDAVAASERLLIAALR